MVKKKIIRILLHILFALPIPVAMLGSLLTLIWFLSSMFKSVPIIESLAAFLGIIIGATYIITYIFSVYITSKEKKISFGTFAPAIHCLIALLYLLTLPPLSKYIADSHEFFGFAKKDFAVVYEIDTHGGFHGDGSYYLTLDCSDNRKEALEKINGWKKLPLEENLSLMMYGGEKNGTNYYYNFAEDAKIPEIKNGYYIFEDRHYESTDSADSSEVLDRGSFNFSIAIYDCDTDKFYLIMEDT